MTTPKYDAFIIITNNEPADYTNTSAIATALHNYKSGTKLVVCCLDRQPEHMKVGEEAYMMYISRIDKETINSVFEYIR